MLQGEKLKKETDKYKVINIIIIEFFIIIIITIV